MSGIFISYRREDTIAYAGRLYDRLVARFGAERVFMDIDTLDLGVDFVEELRRTVASCDVLLAVIGRHWLDVKDEDGRRRLDNPEDFVRTEISAALARNVRVIPVLVNGSTLPRSTDLPEVINGLARRNAIDLPDLHWSQTVTTLIAALEKVVITPGQQPPAQAPPETVMPPASLPTQPAWHQTLAQAPPVPPPLETHAVFQERPLTKATLKTRVAQAEALDEASQARLPTPDQTAYWVLIKAGVYPVGDDSYASLPEKSARLAAFRIGRYPVTVWEYGKYLEATGSKAPPKWEEQQKHPGRPVVRVSWKEARSYCTWAECQLPTEQQWEAAARGFEGRPYPWGDQEADEHRANYGNKVGAPTPVGLFPDGNTPEGVADMAGNVMEWTRSSGFDQNTRSVRGGNFYKNAWHLSAARRESYEPDYWNDGLGFRCVRE